MNKFSVNKLFLTTASLAGAVGVIAALSPVAQAQQARVTGAAVIDDGSGISAVAGEAILAPGQALAVDVDNPITVSPTILDATGITGSGADFTIDELDIDFDLVENPDVNLLENAIATAVADADFQEVSDVISLVEAFGSGVSNQQGQAQVTGAVAFDNDNFISAVAVQSELAPGQQLGIDSDSNGDLDTVNINIDPSPSEGLAIDFDSDSSGFGALEDEISNDIEEAFFDGTGSFDATVSDVVSLVGAFDPNQNSQVGQARITGAATFDDGNRLSALAAEAELAPGQTIDDTTETSIIDNGVGAALDADGAVAFIGGPSNSDDFLDNGELVFTTGATQGGALEAAIAETVDEVDFTTADGEESDAISLVQAFTSNDDENAFNNIPDAPSEELSINPLD